MLRIAVQSKGRLFDDTMNLLAEADIKVSASKRTLLVQSSNFPLEVLYLRDDDIPQSVASGVADIGIVGENEFVERGEKAQIIDRLGFSKRLKESSTAVATCSETSPRPFTKRRFKRSRQDSASGEILTRRIPSASPRRRANKRWELARFKGSLKSK